ncbi:Listeria/Bacterioides repeat [Candidatus Nanopelagicaceae bacterium]
MILDLVRMKGKSLRPKLASILTSALISGLLVSIPVPAMAAACVPTSTTATNGETILTFSTVGGCDWVVPSGVTKAQILIVGGGGGGGDSKAWQTGGGGGAGGYFQANNVNISGTITIIIGAGGTGGANNTATTSTSRGTAGGDSSFGSLKVGGGGGGNSWNYTLGTAALSGNGGSSYLTGGNGGGARSRPNASEATQNGGSGGAHSGSGIVFLGATLTGSAGVSGNNSNGGDFATGGTGGSITAADRTSSITGSAYEYSKPGPFKWAAGAQTYGSGGDANYLGATDGASGGAGFNGVVIVRYLANCSPTRTTTDSDYIYTFTTVGQCGWSVPAGVTSFNALIVGGGGGGGSSLGGGGGGGQVISQTGITLDTSATIWIGSGGSGGNGSYTSTSNHGKKGSDSLLVSGSSNYTALGGSGGNGRMSATNKNADGTAISTGYTGGGGAYPNVTAGINAGTAIAGVGGNTYIGGTGTTLGGGGGGGAGGAGKSRDVSSNASSGGVGVSSDISGTTTFYGGGGGATWYTSKTNWTGAGGNGGGGQGSDGNVVGGNGTANTGGGGGGAYDGLTGGNGGSGVVIIRHARAPSTISYDTNGGNASAPTTQTQSLPSDQLTLATYTGTKSSLRFMNWNTAADGSGTNYKAGEAVRPLVNMTLYAQWMGAYCPEGWTWTEPVCSKSYTGVQNFIIPWGFRSLDVIALGGSGGTGAKGASGAPGKAHASYTFTQGDNIRFYPGGAASGITGGIDSWPHENYNGGNGLTNNGGSGGGGAATVITKNGTATGDVIIVAGGGGGGGANNGCYSQYNPITSTPGNPAASSNGFTYGTDGGSHGYNMFSGAGGGGTNGGRNGGGTAAYSCSSGNDNGGLGLGGYRGGNTISGAAATILNGANTSGGTAGSVTLQLTRPKITYNLNGGTGTTPANQVQTSEGEDLTITSTVPVRTGYTFGGWNTLAAGTGTNYSANAVYNTNAVLNLFAKWTANSYNVIYDTSTVTSGTMANTALTAGTAFTLRTNAFAKVGHTFKDWNTAANGSGTTYTNSQSITLYSDLTLYPQWNLIAPGAPTVTTEAGNTEVTVTPTAAAASDTTVGPTTSMLVRTYNSSGVALNPAKTCAVVSPATSCVITGLTNGTTYQFDATATNATATSAGSTKVNGIPAGVVVTYNATTNGGTSGTASATYSKPTALVLPTASKTGFTFSGWYTAATDGSLIGGAGGNFSPNSSASIVNRSLTSNVATLTTSVAHGFVVGMSVIVINVNSTFNGTYTITSVPTSTTFTYAKTATNVTAAAVSPAGKATVSALTLYAQFVGNTYTITYNGNGNTGGTVPTSGTFQVGGSSYRVLGGTNTPTKTGYTFAGWLSNDLNITRTETFSYTGSSQSWTVPTGITSLSFDVRGARGGNSNATTSTATGCSGGGANIGGLGGKVTGTLNVTGGSTLYFYVGGKGADAVGQATSGGFNGGGGVGLYTNASLPVSSSGCFPGSGGGASDIRTSLGTLSSRLVVAGAGGGAGGWDPSNGGAGGGLVGGNGGSVTWGSNTVATGGTQSAGGNKAAVCGGSYGTSAQLGLGGNGTGCSSGGGGGGGGYYGGGGGQHVSGAGGSSYTHPTLVPSFTHTQGSQDGDGVIAITFGGSGPTTVNIDDLITISSNVVFFAQWTANTNTISYNANTGTGSVPSSGSYVTGASTPYTVLAKPDGLTKSGSQFIGWNTSADGSGSGYSAGASLTTSSNIVLYAQWGAATYSYSFDLNGGTSTQPASGTITHNGQITLPAAPSRSGYTFTGWNDGSTTSNASTSVNLTANKVFVAQWSAQSYSITYDGNGSTSGSVTAGSYVAGGVPYAIAANGFTKTGYTFAGWKDATNNSFIVGAGYSTAANLVLTAQWTASTYTVTYNSNGATSGSSSIASETWTYSPTTPLTLSGAGNLVKTGFTFSNWATTADATTGLTTASPTTNTTYYAVWTATQFTVAYAPGTGASGTIASPGNKTLGQTFTLDSGSTLTPPASNGNVSYSFAFWSDGTKTYKRGATYVMPATNVILTANWIAIYNVTYNPNGGTSSIASVQKTENDQITIEVAATRTGYNFVKWEDQSLGLWNPGDTTTVTAGRFLFNAQWSAKNNSISFNGNSNTGGSVPANGTYITDGTAYVIPGNSGSLVRTGYTFVGWNTLANGTGADYPAGVGATYSAPADLALFAKWQANTYLISYNGNGATGGTAPGNDTYVTGAVNPYTVSTNSGTLTKTGFTFDNWYTTSTGSGGTAYTAGTGTLTTTSDLILYAKWSAASYTVSYASGDNAVSAPSQSTNAYGSSFTLPNALTRTGFTFLGWELGSGASANLYAPAATFTMGSSAITFTAKWSALSYVIVYSLNGGAGSAPTQANVEYNQSFTTAAAPTRSGFTFAGWSDGATTTSASTSISNVTANKTLTAQWTIAVPGVPGTPTATPGNGSATITITPPSSGGTPSSYTITASPGGATCTVTAPGASCTISPLTNGTPYTFTSTATNATGTSASSSSASTAVTPASAPSAPLGVAGSGTGGSSTITWSAPSDNGGSAITDYIVEYRIATSGTWTTFSDGVSTATSASVTGLTAGSSYEFRVTAKNLIGNSLASFTSPVVGTLPAAPSISGVTAGNKQVTVTWNAPTHLGSGTLSGDEYIVTAYDSQGNEAGTCEPTSGQRTCVVTGLSNGSTYTFKVEAITTVGSSDQSSASAAATPSTTPSAPAEVVAVTSGSNMTVTFTAPADNGGAAITSYVITSTPSGATCTVGANATTYTCNGLTAGANYTYTVKAVNVRGESTASQASAAVIAIAVPSAPQNVKAVITAGSTTLSATVSFDPPATDNGSAVISYTVTASPGGATCTVTAPDLYCEIPVLPDSLYTFTARATNAVGTSVASVTSLQTAAANGIAPSLVVDPAPAPTGTLEEGSTLTSTAVYVATPNAVVTYVWKRCTDQFDNTTCTTISGASSSTYILTSADVDKFIRVQTTGANSIGTSTNLSDATEAIVAAPVAPTPSTPSTPTNPSTPAPEPSPAPVTPSCDSSCQAIKDAAAAKAAADATAKAAADKAAADAASKLKADADARTASDKASAAAKAAADAAKTAVDRAGAAAAAKAAADAAANAAAAQAKAASDAQAAANKAAADAAAALRNGSASAAAKAAATATANKAAADAAAAVKAAATAAQNAAKAKSAETNANKQVEIAINSLTSRTAAAQATAEANAIAAAAKAAANEAAAAAATRANEARAAATAAQKAASDAAARIAVEQKEAASAAAAAKAATAAAAKASAEKIAATNAAKTAAENLAKVLNEKAALAEQAANATDAKAREEIAKKIEEIETKVDEVEAAVEEAQDAAEEATAEYEEASVAAEEAQTVAAEEAQDAVEIKTEVATKTAAATKAAATATVAAKVATAAKAAAAKVPSKAVITKQPSTTSKNGAKATVTGLKPGQKVKVTVNVKPKP